MEQKNFATQHSALPAPRLSADAELERLEHLIGVLDDCVCKGIPDAIAQSLDGLEGLKRAAAAMTIVLTDYGGTTPSKTCRTIADELPDLFAAFGQERVLALCEEIQQSELPGQSALFQEMFDFFNDLYFEGRLPHYKILWCTTFGIGRRSVVGTRRPFLQVPTCPRLSIFRLGRFSYGFWPIRRSGSRCRRF